MANEQHGVVLHCQLLAAGLGPAAIQHWIRTGRLQQLHRRVYAVGHRHLTSAGRRFAAVACFGDDAALSHRSAASHWGLLSSSSPFIDVSAPRAKHGSPGVRLHRPRRWSETDRTEREYVRVTTVSRTLLDIAGVVPFGVLERAVNQAQVLEILDFDEVQQAIGRAGRKRGVRSLRAIIERVDPDRLTLTASFLEAEMLRLLRAHALPEPEVNIFLTGHKVDFLWRSSRLVVETDGDRFHSTPLDRDSDRRRDRELGLAGFQVLRFGYRDLRDTPELAIAQIRRALNLRRGLAAGR